MNHHLQHPYSLLGDSAVTEDRQEEENAAVDQSEDAVAAQSCIDLVLQS